MTRTKDWRDRFLVDVRAEKGGGTRRTLSFSRTPTVLLTFAANMFTRQNSAALQERFGIGAMDWRMLVMLTRHPGASVAQSAETIGIDKAAVSRSLRRLQSNGLVDHKARESDPRRKDWSLTPQGHALHDEILAVVLDRLDHQLDGFTDSEISEFSRLLGKLHQNLMARKRTDSKIE